jgi:hypothetical protein
MRLSSVLRFVNRLYLVFSHKYTVSKGFGVLLLLVSHHSIGMALRNISSIFLKFFKFGNFYFILKNHDGKGQKQNISHLSCTFWEI